MACPESIRPRGTYRTLSFTRDLSAREIEQARRYVRGDASARAGLPILKEYEVANIVPTVGRNVFARLLTGDTTYSGEINYGALGDGTTAFTNGTTELNNEVFRKIKSGEYVEDHEAYIDWFIAPGDVADDTYEEFGAFIDGTGSADTGQIFSAVITGGWVKAGSMFINLRITLT